MTAPNQIERDFIVLSPDKKAFIEPADDTLYKRIDETYNGFVGHELVACHEFESDWSSWEVHPHGDEIVLLMAGDVTFLLRTESGDSRITLREQGQYLVVPSGVWHTAKTACKSKLLFITPGQGTQHSTDK
ncbi:cupin domain-containing protein [Saccharospirillum impatiens]|uniref:cupin domain-containing protein n=1 Tax=Saccharospirillum impatiens TaxID=169438 RepID=UPI00042852C3|nr:cupin [Saccharospirillum impatiens]